MAFELHRTAYPGICASNIAEKQIVALASGSIERGVVPVTANTVEPHGVALTVATVGDGVTVHDRGNYVKVRAAASIGANALVGAVSATTSYGPVTAASGSAAWSIGKSVSAAAAGEIFTLHVNPRQLGGLA